MAPEVSDPFDQRSAKEGNTQAQNALNPRGGRGSADSEKIGEPPSTFPLCAFAAACGIIRDMNVIAALLFAAASAVPAERPKFVAFAWEFNNATPGRLL